MGRKSVLALIEEVVERVMEENNIPDDYELYVVAYDFPGTHNPPRFYKNLAVLDKKYGPTIERVQRSVVFCRGIRNALRIALLARHYGARVHYGRLEYFRSIEELLYHPDEEENQ